jgi:hypothetical protein
MRARLLGLVLTVRSMIAPEKQARFLALQRVSRAHVARRYSIVFSRGRHGHDPDDALTERIEGAEWVLAYVPIAALNYQSAAESGAPRISRARAYAARPGALPPGVAKYSAWAQRRKLARGYVLDGNHRVLAAVIRGDKAIRMYLPLYDYAALVRDAGGRVSRPGSRGSR